MSHMSNNLHVLEKKIIVNMNWTVHNSLDLLKRNSLDLSSSFRAGKGVNHFELLLLAGTIKLLQINNSNV